LPALPASPVPAGTHMELEKDGGTHMELEKDGGTHMELEKDAGDLGTAGKAPRCATAVGGPEVLLWTAAGAATPKSMLAA